jgi:hypothetical protein
MPSEDLEAAEAMMSVTMAVIGVELQALVKDEAQRGSYGGSPVA